MIFFRLYNLQADGWWNRTVKSSLVRNFNNLVYVSHFVVNNVHNNHPVKCDTTISKLMVNTKYS